MERHLLLELQLLGNQAEKKLVVGRRCSCMAYHLLVLQSACTAALDMVA